MSFVLWSGRANDPRESFQPLTSSQIDAFRELGFLSLPQFTTPEDLADVATILGRLYERFSTLPCRHAIDLGDESHPTTAPQIAEINWATTLAPELRSTLTFKRCAAVAGQLLGCHAVHTGYDHAILKPPHNGRATRWHQDQAYTTEQAPSVHIWVPLHAVTVEMGCMQFLPGSHLGPVVPHRRHSPAAHAMEAEGIDTAKAVPCPLPAGGATVHHPRTLHTTGPNLTDAPRLAWSLQFGAARPRWHVWRSR